MLTVTDPQKMAAQIRTGTLARMDLTATLDEPVSLGCLPVLWITNPAGEKRFALQLSHADVNRGAAKAGETWDLWINRFGEIFLTARVQ